MVTWSLLPFAENSSLKLSRHCYAQFAFKVRSLWDRLYEQISNEHSIMKNHNKQEAGSWLFAKHRGV